MKTIILIIIVAICSSIDEPTEPCATKIEVQYFKNGKMIHTDSSTKGWWINGLNMCYVGNADSVTFKLK